MEIGNLMKCASLLGSFNLKDVKCTSVSIYYRNGAAPFSSNICNYGMTHWNKKDWARAIETNANEYESIFGTKAYEITSIRIAFIVDELPIIIESTNLGRFDRLLFFEDECTLFPFELWLTKTESKNIHGCLDVAKIVDSKYNSARVNFLSDGEPFVVRENGENLFSVDSFYSKKVVPDSLH